MLQAILFDADGVILRPTPLRRSLWLQLLGGDDTSVEPFLRDVCEIERGCYMGDRDFTRSFSDLLVRWRCSGDLAAALQAWTAIEVDVDVLQIVALLRASGHRCYLASNQEPYRARYISETLAFRRHFDGEFYSCTVGSAKPDSAYFRSVLDAIDVPPDDVLFIDDQPANVDAARAAGIHALAFVPPPHEQWQDHMQRLLANHDIRFASSD